MIYKAILSDDKILEHHGISGQKWGVKHGPPYPLNAQARTNAAKSGKIHVTSNGVSGSGSNSSNKSKQASNGETGSTALVLTAIAAYYGIRAYNSSNIHNKRVVESETKKIVKRLNNKTISSKNMKKLDKPETLDTAITKVNPGNGDMNCPATATSVLLRSLGYDAVATNSLQADNSYHIVANIKAMTNNKADYTTFSQLKQTNISKTEQVLEQKGYTKGTISIQWGGGGGHIFNYTFENGKMTLYDGQSGIKASSFTDYFEKMYDHYSSDYSKYYTKSEFVDYVSHTTSLSTLTDWTNVTADDINMYQVQSKRGQNYYK